MEEEQQARDLEIRQVIMTEYKDENINEVWSFWSHSHQDRLAL